MDKCQHNVLRKIKYASPANYICADDEHSDCHQLFAIKEV